MKRGTPTHPKMFTLSKLLGIPLPHAVGIMEILWQFTANYAPQGDIGKFTDDEIANAVHWEGNSTELVENLIHSRWVDRCDHKRLIIHDWVDHCEDSVKKRVKRNNLEFFSPVTGKCLDMSGRVGDYLPDMSRLPKPLPKPKPKPLPLPTTTSSMTTIEVEEYAKVLEKAIQLYEAYPLKKNRETSIAVIKKHLLAQPGDFDRMLAGVVAFAASEYVRTCPKERLIRPDNWFAAGKWDDDRSLWATAWKDFSKANGPPSGKPSARDERMGYLETLDYKSRYVKNYDENGDEIK